MRLANAWFSATDPTAGLAASVGERCYYAGTVYEKYAAANTAWAPVQVAAALLESGGDLLTMGAVTDGEFLKRDGDEVVSSTVGGLASPLTTKGDIWAYSTTDARFPVAGSDGDVLTKNSGATFGFEWATPGTGKSFMHFCCIGGATTSSRYLPGCNGATVSSSVNAGYLLVATAAGTLSDLYVEIKTVPGAGKTTTATMYYGATKSTMGASGLTAGVTGSNNSANDTSHSQAVSAGDCIAMLLTYDGSAPADITTSMLFTAT